MNNLGVVLFFGAFAATVIPAAFGNMELLAALMAEKMYKHHQPFFPPPPQQFYPPPQQFLPPPQQFLPPPPTNFGSQQANVIPIPWPYAQPSNDSPQPIIIIPESAFRRY